MRDHRTLQAFQLAHRLVLAVYRASAKLPHREDFGLAAQMRRAAVSVAANLAEGCGRGSPGELRRFASIAFGSLRELEYHIQLCRDLGYLDEHHARELIDRQQQTARMLGGFIRSLDG